MPDAGIKSGDVYSSRTDPRPARLAHAIRPQAPAPSLVRTHHPGPVRPSRGPGLRPLRGRAMAGVRRRAHSSLLRQLRPQGDAAMTATDLLPAEVAALAGDEEPEPDRPASFPTDTLPGSI